MEQGPGAVQEYLRECKSLGFDVIELSTGFISLPTDDLVRQLQGQGGMMLRGVRGGCGL
jgi:phosphosulfolactate synthase (CoM biosynthesis protein A)